jgi:hypothetical protein
MGAGTVQACVTSPPYWGLRDYGVDSQLGLEATPEEYVERMVEIFREVRRVRRLLERLQRRNGAELETVRQAINRTT